MIQKHFLIDAKAGAWGYMYILSVVLFLLSCIVIVINNETTSDSDRTAGSLHRPQTQEDLQATWRIWSFSEEELLSRHSSRAWGSIMVSSAEWSYLQVIFLRSKPTLNPLKKSIALQDSLWTPEMINLDFPESTGLKPSQFVGLRWFETWETCLIQIVLVSRDSGQGGLEHPKLGWPIAAWRTLELCRLKCKPSLVHCNASCWIKSLDQFFERLLN